MRIYQNIRFLTNFAEVSLSKLCNLSILKLPNLPDITNLLNLGNIDEIIKFRGNLPNLLKSCDFTRKTPKLANFSRFNKSHNFPVEKLAHPKIIKNRLNFAPTYVYTKVKIQVSEKNS